MPVAEGFKTDSGVDGKDEWLSIKGRRADDWFEGYATATLRFEGDDFWSAHNGMISVTYRDGEVFLADSQR